jgi:hypothetical protein
MNYEPIWHPAPALLQIAFSARKADDIAENGD